MTESLAPAGGAARPNPFMQHVRTRLLHCGPGKAIAQLPYTTGVVSFVAIGAAAAKMRMDPAFSYGWPIVAIAMAAFLLAAALAVSIRSLGLRAPAWLDRDALTAWLLSLHLGVMAMLVPLFVVCTRVPEDTMTGWTFGFMNKRWLIALYYVTVVSFLIFPIAVSWLLSERAAAVASDTLPKSTQGPLGRVRAISGALVVVIVVWFFAGPPWNFPRLHQPFDWHEQATIGPLQAIAKGYRPYLGPASTQYGPGGQYLLFTAMKQLPRFDLIAFRTACAIANLLAFLTVGIVAYWWIGLAGACAVVVLSLAYSPLAFFYFNVDGTFTGFFGWAFGTRYLAPIVVAPAFGYAMIGPPRAVWRFVALGIVWGVGAWIAQENLTATVASVGLLLLILCLTGTVEAVQAVRSAMWIAVGCGCVAGVVLLHQVVHGSVREFLDNYFVVPRAVAVGYSNTWWPAWDADRPDRISYYFTLPFSLTLAIMALWRLPRLRLAAPLDWRRIRFLAFVCVLLSCYPTSLLRSDYLHLMNTMIALPFVLVLAVIDLPLWVSQTAFGRAAATLMVAAVAVATYPTILNQNWRHVITVAAKRFQAGPSETIPYDGRVPYRRARTSSEEPLLAVGSGMPTRTFLEFATDVHDIVGSRKTFVADVGGRAWTGALYFLADLTPAPYPFDREMMTLNDTFRHRVADHIRTHPADYECFISSVSSTGPERNAFFDTHPHLRRFQRSFPGGDGWNPDQIEIAVVDGR